MFQLPISLFRKAKFFSMGIVFISACQKSLAQADKKIDSLQNVLKTSRDDTSKVNTLIELSQLLRGPRRFDEAKKIATEALKLAEQLKFKKGIAFAYNNIGLATGQGGDLIEGLRNQKAALNIWEEIGDKMNMALTYSYMGGNHAVRGLYIEALKYYRLSLQIKEEFKDELGIADIYNGIGVIYKEMGDFPQSLSYLLASLRIREKNKVRSLSAAYNNIGNVYRSLGSYPEALNYLQTAKKLYEEQGNKGGAAGALVNMGNVFQEQGNHTEALKKYQDAMRVFEETGSKGGIAVASVNMGDVYSSQSDFPEALNKYSVALKLFEEVRNKNGIVSSHLGIGGVFIQLKRGTEAREHLMKSLLLAKEMGAKVLIGSAYTSLAKLDSAMGNYEQAFAYYKLSSQYKDSVLNESNSKQIAQMKEQYESEKKDKEILQLTNDKQKLESEKQLTALLIKSTSDSLLLVKSEKEKIRLENERTAAINLYNQQQLDLLANGKKLNELQLEKNEAELTAQKAETERKQSNYLVQKAETDKKEQQLIVLNKEKAIQDLQLKKQRQAKNYFIAGLVLFAVLGFFVYRAYSTRQKLKLLTLRNKIASDLHDDVGSTLSSISIFSQMALEESKEVKPLLQTIGDSSRKMLDAMADIVWTINPENDQFEKIIMRMRSFAYELLGAKHIDFRFVADSNIVTIKLPMEARRNLYLIFKEATNNMVKYAGASKAMFSIKEEQGKLVMMIKDNGKGFESNKATTGNGLKNMKKRAGEMGAILQIDSMPGNGTTIQLELAV